ncbi:putative HTH-type transcriptional regulator [Candidatus Anstonella stagnisolia]|nr:putative HTH-type transcriptional regulator [Candidatus Anstonella stagnisolia]
MDKLDKKDRLILYELDRDCRQPLSSIAKKAGLARESVLYRTKRYKEGGLIRDFLTVVDMSKLGFEHYKVFAKMRHISAAEEKELIQDLCSNPFVTWLGSCEGEYSLIFAIKARSLLELRRVLKEINSKYWMHFLEQDISPIAAAHHFYRDYLAEKGSAIERKIEWGSREGAVVLEEKDALVLDALCKDSRASAAAIAQSVRLSPSSVLQRIRRLEKEGIVTHYTIWPNVNALKGFYYKVLISLHNLDPKKEARLLSYCEHHPNIVFAVEAVAQWQFEMDVEVENGEEFRALMRDFLEKFDDIVSDYTPLNIYQEHKYCFFEKECLKKK